MAAGHAAELTDIGQIPDTVPQTRAAPFEARRRAKRRPFDVRAVRAQRPQARCGVAHGQHLLGIVVPIGGEPQHPADDQLGGQQRGKFAVDQAALAVPFLVPGIRKEHQDLIEALILDRPPEHLDGVVADDAQVGELRPLRPQEQPADARPMYLDAEMIDVRIGLRQGTDDLARAEADLETSRCGRAGGTTESSPQVEG
jgi:hypothetical protein